LLIEVQFDNNAIGIIIVVKITK